ncbi:amidohydrolase [Aestuariivirga sp.]|uniref:amidohydrolase n=1 Tax=Aestuariivirga sp. TaxID=2650926 RepID=UPI0039E40474
MIYSNLRDTDGRRVGLRCEGGLIAEIGPRLVDAPGVAGEGRLLLPALVEPHCHLDKTLWGEPWQQGPGAQTLRGWIENERRVLSACKTPVAVRAGRLMEQMLICGTTAIRSHVDVAPDMGLSHIEAMLEVKQAWAPRVDLQLVAFPQQGVISRPGTLDLLREAMKLGVETMGGLDPAGIDGDPDGQLRGIFDLAQQFDRGIDIHLHDKGALGAWQIRRIADYTEASGLAGHVMVSHAYCLGMISDSELTAIGERLAALKISLMTSAPGDVAVPPVARLTELGVTVCCGSDGIRDAWSPLGNGDMLERAYLTAFRFDWSGDAEFALALSCATSRAATAIGLNNRGLTVGAVADFLMVDALNIGDALARRPQRRRVVRHGRLIADDGQLLH